MSETDTSKPFSAIDRGLEGRLDETQLAELEGLPLASRREFLARALGTGGGLFALGAGGLAAGGAAWAADGSSGSETDLPDAVAWKDPEAFIVHGSNPITMETERSAFGTSVIVPDTRLYVRNNLPVPDPQAVADRDAWEVEFQGVGEDKTLTLGELKSMGLQTTAAVLQCSGNGRKFFPHETSGSQWGVGAAGTVVWSGVPVHKVVQAMGGPKDGMKFLTATGGEKLPEGLDPNLLVVERSIPLEKAMDDTLLAWEMNGAPIPLAHGGPVRLVVPGYYGVNNVKYVDRVAFTKAESQAKIQQSSYRIRPVGESGGPAQPTMWDMNVKSWINHPSGDGESVAAGRYEVNGIAFGGNESVKGVEVSIDGGESWEMAEFLGPDMGPYAWRQFVFPIDFKTGDYTLASRATNASGTAQPKERTPNERGYGDNSWLDHAVKITVA